MRESQKKTTNARLQSLLDSCSNISPPIPGELSDLEKQLNEGGLSVHELEKAKKKIEAELEEAQLSLEVRLLDFLHRQ